MSKANIWTIGDASLLHRWIEATKDSNYKDTFYDVELLLDANDKLCAKLKTSCPGFVVFSYIKEVRSISTNEGATLSLFVEVKE